MNITRRDLAKLATAGSAAVLAPNAQPQSTTELDAKRAENQAAAQAIATVELPMSTEPAFEFKA